tara:strand:+ start:444 stop:800 length:357 start_codon:yes stop_codon:yes gene_type:complete
MIIYKNFFFDAAHYMPNFPKDHKYRKIHGHSYELKIHIHGDLTAENEWVMDLENINKHVDPLLKLIDHNLLNDIKGLENPTSENIAKWFWKELKKKIPSISKVEINRPRIGGCIYQGI